MLGAKLRYLNTPVTKIQYFLIDPIHFIPKYKSTFFSLFYQEILQFNGSFSLLNSDNIIPLFNKKMNSINSLREVSPGN